MLNPYLEEFKIAYGDDKPDWRLALIRMSARDELVTKYSWAVPTVEALELVAKYSPIVEMGAGTGYWASLLQDMGAKVVAYDINPPGTSRNEYKHKKSYVEVLEGSHEKLVQYSDHALFLCWPPYSDPMAHDCLKAFKGDTLLFVGESSHGCTGGEDFWELIYQEWEEGEQVLLPTHPGLHDYLRVFTRKDKS